MHRFLLAVLLASLCACSTEEEPPIVDDFPSMVRLSPSDLQTNVGGAPIYIFASGVVRNSNELLDGVELRDLATGAAVPFVVSTDVGKSLDAGAEVFAAITPKPALVAGWYSVTLKTIPAGVTRGDYSTASSGFLSRFSVDSSPVLRSIAACEKAGAKLRVVVEFSEPVGVGGTGDPAAAVVVSDLTGAMQCPSSSQGLGGAATTVYGDCPQASADGKYRVVFGAGLQTAAGKPLGYPTAIGSGPLPERVDVDTTTLLEASCRVWSP